MTAPRRRSACSRAARRDESGQRLGFTLDEVAEFLEAVRQRHPSPGQRQRARAKLADVEARMADLARIRPAS